MILRVIMNLKLIVILLPVILPLTEISEAAIIDAASCSYGDVSAAISSASAGDTVSVPAGSCTWTSSLTIIKGITLKGAGIGSTVIKKETGSIIIKYQPVTPTSDETFRLTGFTLDENNTGDNVVYIENTSLTTTLTKIRIDHNSILNGITAGIYIAGMVYGVIDNNTINSQQAFRLYGRDDYSWIDPFVPGSANSLYIESNTINNTGRPTSGSVLLSTSGFRWVFRHNTVDLTHVDDPAINAHGNLASSYPDCNWNNPRGTVGTELYENIFTNYNRGSGTFYAHRSGTGFAFNNTLSGTISGCNTNITVREEDDDAAIGQCYPIKTTYPGYDPVKDTYLWNNIHNGAPICFSNKDSALMIIDQQDVWSDRAAGSSGGPNAYFTKGLSTGRSEICGDKSVYWETDTKKLYRCTATNTWTFQYTPYTYPHPLAVDTTPPKRPSGFKINSR